MQKHFPPPENPLLKNVDLASCPVLSEKLEMVSLTPLQILYEPGQEIDYVYFPLRSVISLMSVTENQSVNESCLIGYEGFLGLPLLLGTGWIPHRALVLVQERTLRLAKSDFLTAIAFSETFKENLLRYAQATLDYLSLNIACKAHHSLSQQLARWLLSASDRTDKTELLFTQSFIAQLWGVEYASIKEASLALQKAGLIHYQRGKFLLLDRPGLINYTCECYGRIKALLQFPVSSEEFI